MTRPEWQRDFPHAQVLPSFVRASYHRLPCSQLKPQLSFAKLVAVVNLTAQERKKEKECLMFIYDPATFVFKSIINYKDDNRWASV